MEELETASVISELRGCEELKLNLGKAGPDISVETPDAGILHVKVTGRLPNLTQLRCRRPTPFFKKLLSDIRFDMMALKRKQRTKQRQMSMTDCLVIHARHTIADVPVLEWCGVDITPLIVRDVADLVGVCFQVSWISDRPFRVILKVAPL